MCVTNEVAEALRIFSVSCKRDELWDKLGPDAGGRERERMLQNCAAKISIKSSQPSTLREGCEWEGEELIRVSVSIFLSHTLTQVEAANDF